MGFSGRLRRGTDKEGIERYCYYRELIRCRLNSYFRRTLLRWILQNLYTNSKYQGQLDCKQHNLNHKVGICYLRDRLPMGRCSYYFWRYRFYHFECHIEHRWEETRKHQSHSQKDTEVSISWCMDCRQCFQSELPREDKTPGWKYCYWKLLYFK